MGLENLQVGDWQKLVNHFGFVCLAYSDLQDYIYGLSTSADIFEQKLAFLNLYIEDNRGLFICKPSKSRQN